jgi:hypothetical protein
VKFFFALLLSSVSITAIAGGLPDCWSNPSAVVVGHYEIMTNVKTAAQTDLAALDAAMKDPFFVVNSLGQDEYGSSYELVAVDGAHLYQTQDEKQAAAEKLLGSLAGKPGIIIQCDHVYSLQ